MKHIASVLRAVCVALALGAAAIAVAAPLLPEAVSTNG
jgi:hypothetical protein